MSWHAKPSGGYSIGSAEWNENVDAIHGTLLGLGFTVECIAGIIGNMQAESGLNPWRWQSDRVSESGGYGLVQFTPASGYLALAGTMANRSTSSITSGASPDDGTRQLQAFYNDELGKWSRGAWRPYWSKVTYSSLYSYSRELLRKYGDGEHITLEQFARVNVVQDACFLFLACYEGPAVPNYTPRLDTAHIAYEYLAGHPVPPVPPIPVGTLPEWFFPIISNLKKRKVLK